MSSKIPGNVDLLLYSKFMSGMWPNHPGVAEKCGRLAEELRRHDKLRSGKEEKFEEFNVF